VHIASPIEGVLVAALNEYARDEDAFIAQYGDGLTSRVIVDRGRRFDAIAVETFMRERLSPGQAPVSATPLLERLGLRVVEVAGWGADDERAWRLDAWDELVRLGGVVSPDWMRTRGLYGGAQGVWVDARRTRAIEDPGIAVSVLHTGRHYPDELGDTRIVYHYPRTDRAGLRDANEIEAVRRARELHLPVFVISETTGGRRVRIAWVIADDPGSQTFLMEFAEMEPEQLEGDPEEDAPFALTSRRLRTSGVVSRLDRDATFKFRMLRRYRGRCAVTGVDVDAVLDGAHVVDVRHGGTDDVRNGMLLTADLHRAMDAMLWVVHPRTLRIVTRPQGPTLDELQVDADRLRPDARPPHRDALEWRFKRFVDLLGESDRARLVASSAS